MSLAGKGSKNPKTREEVLFCGWFKRFESQSGELDSWYLMEEFLDAISVDFADFSLKSGTFFLNKNTIEFECDNSNYIFEWSGENIKFSLKQ